MPNIPESVWNQIGVIVVFSFLLAGIGWVLVKIFITSIASINSHYSQIVRENNEQWQKYFDAKSETTLLVDKQVVDQLQKLTQALLDLSFRHDSHDTMVRNALDSMASKRKPLAEQKRPR